MMDHRGCVRNRRSRQRTVASGKIRPYRLASAAQALPMRRHHRAATAREAPCERRPEALASPLSLPSLWFLPDQHASRRRGGRFERDAACRCRRAATSATEEHMADR